MPAALPLVAMHLRESAGKVRRSADSGRAKGAAGSVKRARMCVYATRVGVSRSIRMN